MRNVGVVILLLAACNFCVAISVVYTKHLSRQKYIELSDTQAAIDDLDIEWSRLQIEESTFSEHGLVETVATKRLDMVFPDVATTVMIAR